MIRIGIDAMGGDFAPQNVILGAIDAYTYISKDTKIYLIGDQDKIAEVCNHYGVNSGSFVIVNAPQAISMGEHPVLAYRKKKNSSINVGFSMLANGEIDAFASAGNTGAMLTGSVQTLELLPGVLRPCISAQMPLVDGNNMLILDVGFNSEAKAGTLSQFALLGTVYAKVMMGIKHPRVALLNIGEEKEKGSGVYLEAYKLISDNKSINFVGNMEADKLFNGGIADILVTDGFVGNICLKQTEGMYALVTKLGINHPFLNRFNYEYYGGTPVLGVSAPVVIGHGASTPLAVKNMILEARKAACSELVEKLRNSLSN
jgi:fatty acid/phospholipid synthesis protein PlsX